MCPYTRGRVGAKSARRQSRELQTCSTSWTQWFHNNTRIDSLWKKPRDRSRDSCSPIEHVSGRIEASRRAVRHLAIIHPPSAAPHSQEEAPSSWLLLEEGRRGVDCAFILLTLRGAAWGTGPVLPESEHWRESAPARENRGDGLEQHMLTRHPPFPTSAQSRWGNEQTNKQTNKPESWLLPEEGTNGSMCPTFQPLGAHPRDWLLCEGFLSGHQPGYKRKQQQNHQFYPQENGPARSPWIWNERKQGELMLTELPVNFLPN